MKRTRLCSNGPTRLSGLLHLIALASAIPSVGAVMPEEHQSDPLRSFLVSLATSAEKLGRFVIDPDAVMTEAGLNSTDQAVLKSGNPAAIYARLTAGPGAISPPTVLLVHVHRIDEAEEKERISVGTSGAQFGLPVHGYWPAFPPQYPPYPMIYSIHYPVHPPPFYPTHTPYYPTHGSYYPTHAQYPYPLCPMYPIIK